MPGTTKLNRTRRNGLRTSPPRDTSQPGQSSADLSSTCVQLTFPATGNVTSSPALESGPLRSGSQDGPMTCPCGLEAVPASLSQTPAANEGSTTSATCGRHGSSSSASIGLQSFLENRLRRLLGSRGSTLFRLTWKTRVTPSGRPICALRASAPRTSDSDCSSWPSPKKSDADRGGDADCFKGPKSMNGRRSNLVDAVMHVAAGWATPLSTNHRSIDPQKFIEKKQRARPGSIAVTELQAQVRLVDSGPPPTGSAAETGKCVQLNPEHSRWLMGVRREWRECAPTETRSVRRSPARSSKQRSTG